MNGVKISKNLHNSLNQCRLGVLIANVKVEPSSDQFNALMDKAHLTLIDELAVKNEKEFEVIAQTRAAYKQCGKEPSRYRPSAEALLRRLRTKRSLYRINNVVDMINLSSMTSKFSIGGFDLNNIEGDIVCDIGNANPYAAIGRGSLNIESMPGLKDDKGFFGTPTSDSERTKVTSYTSQLLLIYYDFYGHPSLEEAMDYSAQLIKNHCYGQIKHANIEEY